ncbi:MAG: 50S ribosomal protein L25 [Bacteroidota bacterium]
MKTVSMSGSLRANVGKKDAKTLRREGRVPCVVYGVENQIHFSLVEKEFNVLLFTPYSHIVDLDLEGKKLKAILQDVQFHPVSEQVLHVDFLQVTDDKPVTTSLLVTLKGTPAGVLKGGRMIKKMRKIKVKALIKDLPDEIEINMAPLEIGDTVKVSDMERPNITFIENPSTVVAMVRTTRVVVEEVAPGAEVKAPEGAAAAAPAAPKTPASK